MHYLLNGVYPDVKFQMCSFNNLQVIARFLYFLIFSQFPFPQQPFFGFINKKSGMHYLLNCIYPAVKFEACIFYTFRVIAESRFFFIFTVSFPQQPLFGFINKKSDMHYLLNGIYPAVKFEACIFYTFRVIAESRFFYIFTVSFLQQPFFGLS